MSSSIKKTLIALSISSALVAPSAFATNGYFAHGYSTAEKGMAGAGVAYSQDSMAVANNPAGIAGMGSRMDVGAALFNPNRGYTVSGAPSAPGVGCTGPTDPNCGTFSLAEGSIDSDSDLFLIPHIGYVWQQDSETSIALGVYGNGGMNTNYAGGSASFFNPATGAPITNAPGTFGGGNAGVNLAQLFFNLAYAKKIDSDNSVGASLIFAYQKFSADGLGNFGGFSVDPGNISSKGSDAATGFGAKFGWQGKVAPAVTLGASYQTEIAMSEFDDYAGLFAEGGDFDIPATATIGLAWKTSDKSTLVFDIQQIYYEGVASISNGIANILPSNGLCVPSATGGTGAGCLGGANGGGFGWEDMTVIKLGYEWQQNDMTWRVGLSHGDQPIPDSEVMFNILAPGVMETHLTGGFTMPITSNSEFSFAAMYAPSNSVSGANPMDPAQTIEIEMDQFELQGTYTMKF